MMSKVTLKTRVVTDLMVLIFRLNGGLLEGGDALVKSLGINSARWQLLGAVALADHPLTVPQIAEAMGVTRQGAQKQINKMVSEGFFHRKPNPHHERSPLYGLTTNGRRTFDKAMDRETVWADRLAAGLTQTDLRETLRILDRFYQRLVALDPVEDL